MHEYITRISSMRIEMCETSFLPPTFYFISSLSQSCCLWNTFDSCSYLSWTIIMPVFYFYFLLIF